MPIASGSLVLRVVAGLTGLLVGVGVGVLVVLGRGWPILAVLLFALVLAGAIRALVPPEDRRAVGVVVALSFSLHVAAAVLLYAGALAAGRGGFIPGDDRAYFELADNFVRYLKGDPQPPWVPPHWRGEAYLFGTWVYLESAIFFVVGPEVLVPILLNGTFAVGTSLLVFDISRRLFDRRSAMLALVLTAFFPSLVLWSSLNLKDALALLLMAICLWGLIRFQQDHRWWALALALSMIVPMEGLRRYLFVSLAELVPITVALTPRLRLSRRIVWTAPAALASLLLLSASQAGIGLGPQLLGAFEDSRHAMGIGARTRFVDLPPVVVREGTTFVIATALPEVTPSPDAASAPPMPPTSTPAIVHVGPNTMIVVVTPTPTPRPTPLPGIRTPSPSPTATAVVAAIPTQSTPSPAPARIAPLSPPPSPTATAVIAAMPTQSTPSPTPVRTAPPSPTRLPTPMPVIVAAGSPGPAATPPPVVLVNPGDIVVVGTAQTTPAPPEQRIAIASSSEKVQLRSQEVPTEVVLARTLEYIPRGLAFSLFAPFPWQVERLLDLVPIPEMFLWYVCLAAAVATLIRRRAEWRALFAVAALPFGVLLLLALVEGNVGTLYRHRSMSTPWILLLSAPILIEVLRSWSIPAITRSAARPAAVASDAD